MNHCGANTPMIRVEFNKYDSRTLTLKEACYEDHSLSYSLQRGACVQLRAINGWMALTWLALTLHVLGAIVSLCRWCWRERKYRQKEQGAFVTSAFLFARRYFVVLYKLANMQWADN